jgi:outer membrane scaffolding protein for murein synthesis (MipA/OmpV family)
MPKQFTGAVLALASLFLSAKPINTRAQDAWPSDDDHKMHGLIGLGAASIPDAPGSDDQRTVPLPVLSLRFSGSAFYVGNPFGGSPLQAGAAWKTNGGWRFGAGFSTQANEPREADNRQRAAGVEDIERGSAALVFAQWNYEQVSATLTGAKALGDSEQGVIATLRLERIITPNPRLRITFGPSATWADDGISKMDPRRGPEDREAAVRSARQSAGRGRDPAQHVCIPGASILTGDRTKTGHFYLRRRVGNACGC